MTTFFVQGEAGEFYVIKDDGERQTTVNGPWHGLDVAKRQCERAAMQAGGEAVWTVKPSDVAAREFELRGEYGSRSAWVVR